MKKIIALFVILAFALTLFACEFEAEISGEIHTTKEESPEAVSEGSIEESTQISAEESIESSAEESEQGQGGEGEEEIFCASDLLGMTKGEIAENVGNITFNCYIIEGICLFDVENFDTLTLYFYIGDEEKKQKCMFDDDHPLDDDEIPMRVFVSEDGVKVCKDVYVGDSYSDITAAGYEPYLVYLDSEDGVAVAEFCSGDFIVSARVSVDGHDEVYSIDDEEELNSILMQILEEAVEIDSFTVELEVY